MPATPPRDHIATIIVVLLLHALLIASLAMRDAGGSPGQGAGDAIGHGQEDWIAVNFLKKESGPKPSPATVDATPPHAQAEDPRASEAVPPQDDAKAEQNAAASETTQDGGGSSAPLDNDLGARYLAAVRAAVLAQWNTQGGNAIPAGCVVVIDQAAGGKALRAWVMQCTDLPLGERIRLETAVMQVQSFPYAGFEPVFQAHIELTF